MAHNGNSNFYPMATGQHNSSFPPQPHTSGNQQGSPDTLQFPDFDSAGFEDWSADDPIFDLEQLTELDSLSSTESQAGLAFSAPPTASPKLSAIRMAPFQHIAQPSASDGFSSQSFPTALPTSWPAAFVRNDSRSGLPLDGTNTMIQSYPPQRRAIPFQDTQPWEAMHGHLAAPFPQSAPAFGATNTDMEISNFHTQGSYTHDMNNGYGRFAPRVHNFEPPAGSTIHPHSPISSTQSFGQHSAAPAYAPPFEDSQSPVHSTNLVQQAPSSSSLVGPSITNVSLADGSQVRLRYDYDDPRDAAERFAVAHSISPANKDKLEAYLRGVYRQVWGTEFDDDNWRTSGEAEAVPSASVPAASARSVDKTAAKLKSNQKRAQRRKQTRRASTVFIPKAELRPLPGPLSQVSVQNNWPPRDALAKINRPAAQRHAEHKKTGSAPRPCNSWILYRWAYGDVAKQFCGSGNQQSIGWIISASWRMETDAVREEWAELARHEEQMHALAWPNYKYKPTAPGAKQEQQAEL